MRIVLLVAALTVAAFAAAVVVTLSAPDPTPLGRVTPGPVAYLIHASLGAALNRLGLSPVGAATQWVRAASHAASPGELSEAGQGIAAARQRSAGDWRVEDVLCNAYTHGAPEVRAAIGAAGAPCSAEAGVFAHVPEDIAISYTSRPPVGGPHFPTPYPEYGLTNDPVVPGYWVHNLEHGAVVLLYRCQDSCPELVAELQAFSDALPIGRNARHKLPRLLITRYAEMDHRLAMVAWGRKLEMDSLDQDQAQAFYAAYIDRGPECRDQVCPY